MDDYHLPVSVAVETLKNLTWLEENQEAASLFMLPSLLQQLHVRQTGGNNREEERDKINERGGRGKATSAKQK
jgi:hypothetical protein